jgi:hypothetical protein
MGENRIVKKNCPVLFCILGACMLAGAAHGQSRGAGEKYYASYEWAASGSLPPRYHYQYRIDIEPSGKGNIVMVPEYPTIYDADIPRWKETFEVDTARLEKLNGLIETSGMLSPEWEDASKKDGPLAPQPRGTATCGIDIRMDAQSSHVPCNDWEIPSPLRKKRDEFADMMKKFVPAKSWARLNDAQRQYISH